MPYGTNQEYGYQITGYNEDNTPTIMFLGLGPAGGELGKPVPLTDDNRDEAMEQYRLAVEAMKATK